MLKSTVFGRLERKKKPLGKKVCPPTETLPASAVSKRAQGNSKRQQGKHSLDSRFFCSQEKAKRVVIYRVHPNCTWKFKNSQLKLTLWNGTAGRVEHIRHAFQTTAPESACKADTTKYKGSRSSSWREPQLWPEAMTAYPKDESDAQPWNDTKPVELSNTWSSSALTECYG